MKKSILFKGICIKRGENYRKAISFALIIWLILGVCMGMLNMVFAPGGQDYNIWGTATDGTVYPGLLVPDGSEISAWIDGISYGTNITKNGMYDLYVDGDYWGTPQVDLVKTGGYDGDAILYFLNYNPMGSYLNVSHTTSIYNEGFYEHVDPLFFNRTDQAPGLTTLRMLKINEIVLDPDDGMSQYVVVYDPGKTLGMNNITDYYLQKDNNVTHTIHGETFDFLTHASDIIDMGDGYYYINLTSDLELNYSDELKLVWTSPYVPNIDPSLTGPGNGIDIIVDRVEWGNYKNYINPLTPPDDRDYDNTTMPDFIDVSGLHGSGASMIRTDNLSSSGYSGNGTDTDNCLADFKLLGTATPRPPTFGSPIQNIDTGEYFDSIQAAIDDPDTQDGHRIAVSAGIYPENVVINKMINLTGEDRDNTIIDGNDIDDVIEVTANNTLISGFTIRNHETIISSSNNGIYLNGSSGNVINGNIVRNCASGIYVWSSDNNTIIRNHFTQTNWNTPAYLYYSDDNTFTKNIVYNSEEGGGLYVTDSDSNIFYHNNFFGNGFDPAATITGSSSNNVWDDGYPSGGNYWSDYSGIDDYSGPDQDLQGRDGMGDTDFSIYPEITDHYPLIGRYPDFPTNNYTNLKQGWNLISIPLMQGERNLSIVLGAIDGMYDAVQWYDITDKDDPWKHFRTGKPFGNDLTHLNETTSFWVHISSPGDTIFLYNGAQPTSNQSIPLHPGWNQVGYPSLSNRNRTAALNNLDFGNEVDAVWTFDAATQNWEMVGTADDFEVGRGYWVHAAQECVWDVPL